MTDQIHERKITTLENIAHGVERLYFLIGRIHL